MPRSSLKVNRRFGGTYRPHLLGRRISRARNHFGFLCYILGDSTLRLNQILQFSYTYSIDLDDVEVRTTFLVTIVTYLIPFCGN
jgi:hypothetical protein